MIMRSDQRSLSDIAKYVSNGKFYLSNKARWENPRASLLIQVITANTPLPLFITIEDKRGRLQVAFGGRSLQTILEYAKGGFSLNLPQHKLHGKSFSDLHPFYQARIEDARIDFLIIEKSSDQEMSELRTALNLED